MGKSDHPGCVLQAPGSLSVYRDFFTGQPLHPDDQVLRHDRPAHERTYGRSEYPSRASQGPRPRETGRVRSQDELQLLQRRERAPTSHAESRRELRPKFPSGFCAKPIRAAASTTK